MEHILIYSTGALALIVIILIIWIALIHKKIKQLTAGANGTSLENIISENNRSIRQQKEVLNQHRNQIESLEDGILSTFQNIGVIRFNPFKDTGGNQSFAIALLNKKNDGVIISSLYTRERVNVFAKPIINGASEFKLTDEEQQALTKAQL